MPQQPWFLSSTPTLSQLGATMGYGVTPTASQMAGVRALGEATANEDARRWDLNYQQNKQSLDQQYDISRRNARTAEERAEIDRWYNREQVKIARERLSQEDRQFNLTHGLNQAKLGYDLLGLQASLRGPEDYFAASNLARGASQMPGTATFLSALRDNTTLPGFVGSGGAPTGASLTGLSNKLTGGPSAGTDALHGQIQQIGLAPQKLGAGVLEQLSGDELGLLKSGLETPGADGTAFSWNTFLDQHRKSRIGQNIGATRAA